MYHNTYKPLFAKLVVLGGTIFFLLLQPGSCTADIKHENLKETSQQGDTGGGTEGSGKSERAIAPKSDAKSSVLRSDMRFNEVLLGVADSMSKVTGFLSLQVSIISGVIAFVGLMLGAIIVSINSYLKKTVNEKMYDILDKRLNESLYESSRLNAVLYSSMFGAIQDVCLAAKRKITSSAEGKMFSDLSESEWNEIVNDLADIVLTPAKLIALINKIAASDKTTVGLKQDIYVIWAEVKTGSIKTHNMRIMLSAIVDILSKLNFQPRNRLSR